MALVLKILVTLALFTSVVSLIWIMKIDWQVAKFINNIRPKWNIITLFLLCVSLVDIIWTIKIIYLYWFMPDLYLLNERLANGLKNGLSNLLFYYIVSKITPF